jgi:Rrf2 family protein
LQLRIIAEHQDISLKYLEQLITILRSAGFVRSVRGARGGYALAKAANQITLDDVFKCLEGPVITADCVESESYCARAADCVVKQVWAQVEEAVRNVLKSITLKDLVDKAKDERAGDFQI